MNEFLSSVLGFADLEWNAFMTFITGIYTFIFPECPQIGIVLVSVTLALFIFYTFKSGFSPAFRIATTVLVIVTAILFAIHHMGKLLHINLLFF